ncbi:MAG: hypothetical protein QM778_28965 [Myxococcales bacterium]
MPRWHLFVMMVLCLLTLIVTITARPRRARAEDPTAEQLFQSGKDRLAQEDYERACPLFSESFRLEPATGCLLALAVCYERAGRLASALSTYREVKARAAAEGRRDREAAAAQKEADLEARVSSVIVSAPSDSQVLVELDDLPLEQGQLGKRLYLDGGAHRLRAKAVGKQEWTTQLVLSGQGDSQLVSIPALPPEAAPQAASPAPPSSTPRKAPKVSVARVPEMSRSEHGPAARSPVEWVAISAMSAGGVALSASFLYTLRAVHSNHVSDVNCVGNQCTPDGRADRLEARDYARNATILVSVGGALAAGGLATFLWWRLKGSKEAEQRARANLSPWLFQGSVGAQVSGRF